MLQATQAAYRNVLRLATTFNTHLQAMVQVQKELASSFNELAMHQPELHEDFQQNYEAQKALCVIRCANHIFLCSIHARAMCRTEHGSSGAQLMMHVACNCVQVPQRLVAAGSTRVFCGQHGYVCLHINRRHTRDMGGVGHTPPPPPHLSLSPEHDISRLAMPIH